MGTMVNRRRAYGGKNLPYYDAEIEYLESTGSQYIFFTAANPINNGYRLECEYNLTTGAMFGAQFKGILAYNGTCRLYDNRLEIPFRRRLVLACEYNNGLLVSIDNSFVGSISVSAIDYGDIPYGLFVNNGANINTPSNNIIPADKGTGKIYRLSISKNNALVRDLIPVRVGTTGYMYDKVSGHLFGNSGTGDFVLGPDK